MSAEKHHRSRNEQSPPAEGFHGAQPSVQMWLMPAMSNVRGITQNSLTATHMLYKEN